MSENCKELMKKLEEKNLIILELEKVILDFMDYNKVNKKHYLLENCKSL